jgi:hypothetical protein
VKQDLRDGHNVHIARTHNIFFGLIELASIQHKWPFARIEGIEKL